MLVHSIFFNGFTLRFKVSPQFLFPVTYIAPEKFQSSPWRLKLSMKIPSVFSREIFAIHSTNTKNLHFKVSSLRSLSQVNFNKLRGNLLFGQTKNLNNVGGGCNCDRLSIVPRSYWSPIWQGTHGNHWKVCNFPWFQILTCTNNSIFNVKTPLYCSLAIHLNSMCLQGWIFFEIFIL